MLRLKARGKQLRVSDNARAYPGSLYSYSCPDGTLHVVHCNVTTGIKVSARVQDRPRADPCSAFISLINPNKPYIF